MTEVESSAQTKNREDRADFRRGGIVVAVGLWLLASSLHIGGLSYANSWPLLLILIGVVISLFPQCGKGPLSGVLLIAWGVLAVIAVHGLWGFGWFNIWPLFLIVVGVEMVVNAIVAQRRSGNRAAAKTDNGGGR